MNNGTKTFKSYNFVTGAVDGTLAYDFGNPELYTQEEVYESPRRRGKEQVQEQEWIKEDTDVRRETVRAERTHAGISALSLVGCAVVVVLLIMTLLAQIQLTDISDTAVSLENQIEELTTERDKLTVEYETVFNLKDVEEYAVGVLGMQEPKESQISYLSGVSSADKAVVVTPEATDMFSLGLEDLLASVKAYFD